MISFSSYYEESGGELGLGLAQVTEDTKHKTFAAALNYLHIVPCMFELCLIYFTGAILRVCGSQNQSFSVVRRFTSSILAIISARRRDVGADARNAFFAARASAAFFFFCGSIGMIRRDGSFSTFTSCSFFAFFSFALRAFSCKLHEVKHC